MRDRMLREADGRLYDGRSPAAKWALDHLRDILQTVGFVVEKRRERETTLRVYPVRRQVYPLLNPEFFLIYDQDGSSENLTSEELIRIVVLSKGEREKIDSRLSRMSLSDRVRYEDRSERLGAYWHHGNFWIPVEFTGPVNASEISLAKLADPLAEILRALN